MLLTSLLNGSIGWETYLAAALLGGIIGGVLGYYAGPTIASLLANPGNISLASLVFAGGSTGGLTISIAAVGQIALAGAVSTTAIGTIGATYMFYDRKLAAPRIKSKSKKEAYQKAFQKGGKNPPIHHNDPIHGPHFHPNVPKGHRFEHWHYFYLWIFALLGLRENE